MNRGQDNISPEAKHNWELEQPNPALSFELLLQVVNESLNNGIDISQALHQKLIVQTNGSFQVEEIAHNNNQISEYFEHRTTKSAVGIRHMYTDIADAVYVITRSPEKYPGKYSRQIGVVHTCLIHVGLSGLNLLLEGRSKVVERRKQAIWKGGKEKRQLGPPPRYRFIVFTETLSKQQNVYTLSPNDYARAATIAEDYEWDLSFVIQMAIIIAISNSETLPSQLIKDATQEAENFKVYLEKHY